MFSSGNVCVTAVYQYCHTKSCNAKHKSDVEKFAKVQKFSSYIFSIPS